MNFDNKNISSEIIDQVDKINKKENINLVVINFGSLKKIPKKVEEYLIKLNKKVLVISKDEIQFSKLFLGERQVYQDIV